MKVVSSPPLFPRKSARKMGFGAIVAALLGVIVAYALVCGLFGASLLGILTTIQETSEWRNPLGFWDCATLMAFGFPFVFLFRSGD